MRCIHSERRLHVDSTLRGNITVREIDGNPKIIRILPHVAKPSTAEGPGFSFIIAAMSFSLVSNDYLKSASANVRSKSVPWEVSAVSRRPRRRRAQ